jgi:hypothetical protein
MRACRRVRWKKLCRDLQVFEDGELGEDVLGLRHKAHAVAHQMMRSKPGHIGLSEPNLACEAGHKTGNGLDHGGFSSAVGAENRDSLAAGDVETHALDDRQIGIITGVQTGHGQRGHAGIPSR